MHSITSNSLAKIKILDYKPTIPYWYQVTVHFLFFPVFLLSQRGSWWRAVNILPHLTWVMRTYTAVNNMTNCCFKNNQVQSCNTVYYIQVQKCSIVYFIQVQSRSTVYFIQVQSCNKVIMNHTLIWGFSSHHRQ